MNKEKIRKLIRELEELDIPTYSDDKEIDSICTDLILYHSNYIAWERAFLENRFDKNIIKPEIYIDEDLNNRIKNFKPSNKEDKRCLEQIKRFKDKMDEIVKELIKS